MLGLVLITIGSVTGVSIAALFTGGLLPAIVLAIGLCAVVWWRYRGEDLSHVQRATRREIGRAFLIAIPAIALPFVIRAAVVEGVATATEVSTIGIVYSVLAGLLIYRQFDWRRLYPMLVETAALSGAILFIIGAATGMAWALTQSGFSASLAKFMTSLPGGVPVFLIVTIIAFVILGSVLEGIPADRQARDKRPSLDAGIQRPRLSDRGAAGADGIMKPVPKRVELPESLRPSARPPAAT